MPGTWQCQNEHAENAVFLRCSQTQYDVLQLALRGNALQHARPAYQMQTDILSQERLREAGDAMEQLQTRVAPTEPPPSMPSPATPSTCLFCGGSDLVATHVWPEWLSRQCPDINGQNVSQACLSLSQNLVCAACSTGWMAALEDQAAALLAPVLNGKPSIIPGRKAKALAGWLCLLAVKLAAACGTCIIPRSDIAHLRHTGQPPQTWSIFVAGLCEARSPPSLRHDPCRIEFSGNPMAGHSHGRPAATCNSQTLSIGFGPLFFHLFSSPSLITLHDFAASSRREGLTPLWPPAWRFGLRPNSDICLPPKLTLTGEAAARITDTFAAQLKARARRTSSASSA